MAVDDESAGGYWFAGEGTKARSVAVLDAMRDYRSAEAEMRKRTRESMNMNESDLLALRIILGVHRTGRGVSPTELSKALGITSASTTGLVDRLVAAGHAERQRNPADGRAVVIVPTTSSETEVRLALSDVHDRMIEAADGLDDHEATIVIAFLASMREAVEKVD